MYHRGTIEQFNAWHEPINTALGYPVPSTPDKKMRTKRYSSATQNPDGENDYIWLCGDYKDDGIPSLTKEEYKALGWFMDEV